MPSTPFDHRRRFSLAPAALIAALGLTAGACGQTVPGFTIEVFATPAFPNLLSFGANDILYAGRDDDAGGSITPRHISKITPDGNWSPYGLTPILDPDAIVADVAGDISGIAGSVLVGGLITNPGAGRVSAIHPDGNVVTLFEALEFGNISEMKIDDTGRLLFVSFNGNKTYVSVSGATPTVLFSTGTSPVYLTVAPDGRIFTGTQAGTVRINAANGALINATFAQFTGRTAIEFGEGGGFGTDLLALDTAAGILYSVSDRGAKTQIGSGFVGTEDIAVGDCGALYVSRRLASQVLRITRPPSPDVNDSGLVDASDLALLLGAWSSTDCSVDLNQDGSVNAEDLAILLGAWGTAG